MRVPTPSNAPTNAFQRGTNAPTNTPANGVPTTTNGLPSNPPVCSVPRKERAERMTND